MPNKAKRVHSSWFHFQLWEALVFTLLVAALFAVSRRIQKEAYDFPDAPQVSLAFAKKQIADGKVQSMQLGSAGDVLIGYAKLSESVIAGKSTTETFLVAMPESDGSARRILTLLETNGVPWITAEVDPLFVWICPIVGTAMLCLAALVYLRFKNSRRQSSR